MSSLHPLFAEIVEAHGLTTAREIAEQSAHKGLGRFGAAIPKFPQEKPNDKDR